MRGPLLTDLMRDLARTLAVRLRDSAHERRIAYVRHEPFGHEVLRALALHEPAVHRFSSYLDNAMDAWSVELVGGGRATGAIGGRSFVATFGKTWPRAGARIDGQRLVEHCLEQRFGPLLFVRSLPEADRWFRDRERAYC